MFSQEEEVEIARYTLRTTIDYLVSVRCFSFPFEPPFHEKEVNIIKLT